MRRVLALLLLALLAGEAQSRPNGQGYLQRPPEDEIIYLVMPDRFDNADPSNDSGGISGGRLLTGFDPSDKAFFHGGDLKGVLRRLNYIQGLGATAIWLTPVFTNKPVQGAPGQESAGYHGYWITDFTSVDPHFGTRADLKRLVDAAHARGMKVYLDIVVNHTADVIQYRECGARSCPYRGLADYPYVRHGGAGGMPINGDFMGDDITTDANWSYLTRADYAYTPFVPPAEAHVKKPDWLNDPIYYHNRGNSLFKGESSIYGDFGGLDDVMTEHPRVIRGMIDIYGHWIAEFRIDGYRIDTEQHVNPAFWRAFVPAILARARSAGVPDFHMFGEVMVGEPDVARLARHTREDALPAVMDYAVRGAIVRLTTEDAPTDVLGRVYSDDVLYEGGSRAALRNTTFNGNYDVGRIGAFLRRSKPKASSGEELKRALLAHALVMFGRGVPVIYYGDEQGLTGKGDDQLARQDMFPTRTAIYAADTRIGGGSGSGDHFQVDAPLYRALAAMARIRTADPRLRRGDTRVRASGDAPGLFAYSRTLPGDPGETLVAVNTSNQPVRAQLLVESKSIAWTSRMGECTLRATAPGSYAVTLPPLGFVVCSSPGSPN